MAETRDLSIPSVLFLKLQTSGLYRTDLSMDDAGQPWAMETAAMLCNSAGVTTQSFCHVVKSEGRSAKDTAVKVHGITARATDQIGIPERRVLGCLTDMLRTAPPRAMKVVTFGDFDARIVSSLLARFAFEMTGRSTEYDRLWLSRPLTKFIDVQKPYAQMLCKLPSELEGSDGFKWPSLEEASQIILGRPARTTEFHDAMQDLVTLKDLYFELARLGYVERQQQPEAVA